MEESFAYFHGRNILLSGSKITSMQLFLRPWKYFFFTSMESLVDVNSRAKYCRKSSLPGQPFVSLFGRISLHTHLPSLWMLRPRATTVAVVVFPASLRPSTKGTHKELLILTAVEIVCTYELYCCLRPGINILAAFVCQALPCRCNIQMALGRRALTKIVMSPA